MNASNATNPASLLGFGTWAALGAGRMLLGDGGGFSAGGTGGASTTTLSIANLPSHTHTATVTDPGHLHAGGRVAFLNNGIPSGSNDTTSVPGNTATAVTGITVSNSSTGSGTAATTISPYLVVYMWQRTA
jgi:microcystin-dependent protein